MLENLRSTRNNLYGLWQNKKQKLDQCFQLKLFEQDAEKVREKSEILRECFRFGPIFVSRSTLASLFAWVNKKNFFFSLFDDARKYFFDTFFVKEEAEKFFFIYMKRLLVSIVNFSERRFVSTLRSIRATAADVGGSEKISILFLLSLANLLIPG